jgi:hypothetical protein
VYKINRKLLRQVAKKHGVSVAEVKRGMAEAIDHAYENPNPHAQSIKFAGEKPTPDELIAHLAQAVNKQKVKN